MARSEPFRDKAYLAYIRLQPCLVCGGARGPSEAHHEDNGGKGLKGSDYRALPLCSIHHRERHDTGQQTFWTRNNLDPRAEMLRYLEWYLVYTLTGRPPKSPSRRPPERPG
ncbi:MAG: DUF968 domain-containing protein [Proteobacteria bacterium]|nr:DUF968 domain-containing protein [Pseudomonadota bacterium]MBU1740789.1 DUF968 domain-containing protein [Pseudomonadota bacterium]